MQQVKSSLSFGIGNDIFVYFLNIC